MIYSQLMMFLYGDRVIIPKSPQQQVLDVARLWSRNYHVKEATKRNWLVSRSWHWNWKTSIGLLAMFSNNDAHTVSNCTLVHDWVTVTLMARSVCWFQWAVPFRRLPTGCDWWLQPFSRGWNCAFNICIDTDFTAWCDICETLHSICDEYWQWSLYTLMEKLLKNGQAWSSVVTER